MTHYEQLKRHEIVNKIAKHARTSQWTCEIELRVCHEDGQLYNPDLAINLKQIDIVICDVQVSWEGNRPLAESWARKLVVYDNQIFREAASRRWPGKQIKISPLILGARGIWL